MRFCVFAKDPTIAYIRRRLTHVRSGMDQPDNYA